MGEAYHVSAHFFCMVVKLTETISARSDRIYYTRNIDPIAPYALLLSTDLAYHNAGGAIPPASWFDLRLSLGQAR